MFRLGVTVLLASIFILSCHGTPQGAPKSSCSSLTPVHSGIAVQRTQSSYSVSAVRNGDRIRVKISSTVGEEFSGFALQARSSKNKNVMIDGKFTVVDGVTKTIDCFKGSQNTLTHVNTNQKREVVTDWTPSKGINEDVIFRATVAKTYALFWTEIDSPSVKIQSGGSASSQQSNQDQESDRMYHNCFETKGCFGLPSGCTTSRDCEVFLTYSTAPDGIAFRISGFLEPQTYMAMGLSRDQNMGDDLVHECFRDGSRAVLRESWNEGKSNTRTRELPRNMYSGEFTNGLTTCSWTAKYLTEYNGRRFNLENSTYYLLLAKGPMRNDRISYHSDRIASQDAVNFTAFELIEGEGVSDSIKIHGTFMVTAWVGLVSFAILLARHFKASWESRTLCGVKIWFALHRGLMFTALVFVVIAFIVIFVHKEGWNYETKNPHAILGCITTALGLFQPIMAAFRPGPDSPKRPIFNWLHWTVGNGAQILAVITIFFAVSLEASGLKENFYWVMAIFVVIHVFFHFLFQVHTWTAGKKKSNEVKMLDMNSGRGNIQNNGSEKNEKSLADSVFRILLLGIYAIFLVVIVLALYGLIGVA